MYENKKSAKTGDILAKIKAMTKICQNLMATLRGSSVGERRRIQRPLANHRGWADSDLYADWI